MEFEDNIIIFKSMPMHYEKEHTGTKPNTVRYISEAEGIRHTIRLWEGVLSHGYGLYCDEIDTIRIINSETEEYFERTLSDVTQADINGLSVYVFSWKHPVTPRQALDEIDDCFPIAEYLREAGYKVDE